MCLQPPHCISFIYYLIISLNRQKIWKQIIFPPTFGITAFIASHPYSSHPSSLSLLYLAHPHSQSFLPQSPSFPSLICIFLLKMQPLSFTPPFTPLSLRLFFLYPFTCFLTFKSHSVPLFLPVNPSLCVHSNPPLHLLLRFFLPFHLLHSLSNSNQ